MVLLAASLQPGCGERPAAGPDVLLITVDTLRADFVHIYGFSHETTPNMDALAARGALFETAIAASTATAPAHASIMTSRYVREHSVGSENGPTRLAEVETLAHFFRAAGYETAAFVSNVVLKARTGLDQGFDVYDDELPSAEVNREVYFERTADETAGRALAWLARPRDGPFFVWVHLQDPHGPYAPPGTWADSVDQIPLRTDRDLPVLGVNRGRGGIPDYQALEGVRQGSRYAALYAGEIAFTDHWIGELVGAVDPENAVIALTADHGESLDEDGFFFQHGHTTTPEQARVPLILAGPGIVPRRIAGVSSHVDIAPTLLELAGLPGIDAPSGISLASVLDGKGSLPDRQVVSDVGHELSAYDEEGYVTVKVLGNGRLDWQRFEVAREGGGYQRARKAEGGLPPFLRAYVAAEVPVVPALAMSDEDLSRLQALGYLPPELPPELSPETEE